MPSEAAYEPEPTPARRRFDVLESCRGFLAVTVILYHLNAATHFQRYFHNAFVAVDFFFVLSGFVIASVYQDRLTSPAELGKYLVRRFGRLYPLHAFMLGLYVLLELWKAHTGDEAFTGPTSVPALKQQLLLVQAFFPDHLTWNYPAWSISIEFWVNVAIGFVILFARRATVLVTALITVALGLFFFSGDWVNYDAPTAVMENLFNTAEYVVGFLAGMLTFSLYRVMERAGLTLFWGLDLLALAMVVLVYRTGLDMPPLSKPAVFSVVVLIFAFEKGSLSALLRLAPCRRLGVLSYSIYLTHSLHVLLFASGLEAVGAWLGQPVSVPDGTDTRYVIGGPWVLDLVALALVGLVILTSGLTYRFVEDPARRFFNRLAGGRASAV